MTTIALLLRLGVMLCRSLSVTPRIFADDLLLHHVGSDVESLLCKFALSLDFFNDLGAKLASDSLFLFSSHAGTRKQVI